MENSSFLDKKVWETIGKPKYPKGDFGIEIEMELSSIVDTNAKPNVWKHDPEEHSLKGFGYEFVLKSPTSFEKALSHLRDLENYLEESGVRVLPSLRASSHIHLNMCEKTMREVLKFLAVYYPLESAIVNSCGDGRTGNLFCLRAIDSPYQINCLTNYLQTGNILDIRTDDLRYSALNLQS